MVAGVGLVLCSSSVKLPGFGLQFLLPGLRPPAPQRDERVQRVGGGTHKSTNRAILKYMLNYAMSGLKLAG